MSCCCCGLIRFSTEKRPVWFSCWFCCNKWYELEDEEEDDDDNVLFWMEEEEKEDERCDGELELDEEQEEEVRLVLTDASSCIVGWIELADWWDEWLLRASFVEGMRVGEGVIRETELNWYVGDSVDDEIIVFSLLDYFNITT